MLIDIQILCWNCLEAKSDGFLWELKEIKRCYRPTIFILLEPKINKAAADEACRKMGRTHLIHSKAEGFRGVGGRGWLLWDKEEIQIDLKYAHKSFLHVAINLNGVRKWELSTIYAIPNPCVKRHLWNKLNEMKVENQWLLIGDFICTLGAEERSSNRGGTLSIFQSWVSSRGLMDMGWIGPPFTWNQGNSIDTRKAACLDRGLCDGEWRHLFLMLISDI